MSKSRPTFDTIRRHIDAVEVLDWFDPWPFESSWDVMQGLDTVKNRQPVTGFHG